MKYLLFRLLDYEWIKSFFYAVAPVCFFLLNVNNSFAQTELITRKDVVVQNKEILIVYLSRTNNTKALAEIIHKKVGGDLVALELVTPYPADYKATVRRVAEENRSGFLPPLKTKIDSIKKYDVIFIGFPTWGMQLPPPVKSFLSENNFSGKTVIPFNTNGGYGIGSSFETVEKLCHGSKILEGYSTKGGEEIYGILYVMKGDKETQVKLEVQEWLEKIGLVNK